jgi:MFS family permease
MLERLGPLQERNFRRLWIGQTTSAVGDSLSLVAITFAVLAVRGSATDLGFVLAANMIPRVVFLLVGGVWADRLPRRSLMVAADAVRAAAQVGLAVAVLGGGADLWVFVLASVASGAASAFFMPAATGLIPQAVSEERLQQGNALLNLSQSTAFMAGPIVSGLLVAAVGAGWVFAIDGATFAVSAGSLLLLHLRPVPSPVRRPFTAELADGWREVVARRWLVISLAAFTFGNLAYAALFVLGPVLMDRQFNGAADWGLLMGCFGFGGLLGGAIALRWRPSRPLLATFAVLLAAPVALLLLAVTPPLAALAIGMVVLAAATSIANTLWHTTIQQQVPADSISRVSSYDWMVSLLIFPVGSALAGPFADAASVGSALVLFAALAGVPVALVLLAPSVREVRRRDAPPEAEREEIAAGAAAA